MRSRGLLDRPAGVGYETIPIALCKELGVTVTNLPGHNAKAVAEVALGLAISVVRRIAEFDRRMRRGEVLPSVSWLSGTVEGKTLGIVGMGNIAREVAKKFMVRPCLSSLHARY